MPTTFTNTLHDIYLGVFNSPTRNSPLEIGRLGTAVKIRFWTSRLLGKYIYTSLFLYFSSERSHGHATNLANTSSVSWSSQSRISAWDSTRKQALYARTKRQACIRSRATPFFFLSRTYILEILKWSPSSICELRLFIPEITSTTYVLNACTRQAEMTWRRQHRQTQDPLRVSVNKSVLAHNLSTAVHRGVTYARPSRVECFKYNQLRICCDQNEQATLQFVHDGGWYKFKFGIFQRGDAASKAGI